MTVRILHCGTGNVGASALRVILDRSDLEFVVEPSVRSQC